VGVRLLPIPGAMVTSLVDWPPAPPVVLAAAFTRMGTQMLSLASTCGQRGTTVSTAGTADDTAGVMRSPAAGSERGMRSRGDARGVSNCCSFLQSRAAIYDRAALQSCRMQCAYLNGGGVGADAEDLEEVAVAVQVQDPAGGALVGDVHLARLARDGDAGVVVALLAAGVAAAGALQHKQNVQCELQLGVQLTVLSERACSQGPFTSWLLAVHDRLRASSLESKTGTGIVEGRAWLVRRLMGAAPAVAPFRPMRTVVPMASAPTVKPIVSGSILMRDAPPAPDTHRLPLLSNARACAHRRQTVQCDGHSGSAPRARQRSLLGTSGHNRGGRLRPGDRSTIQGNTS